MAEDTKLLGLDQVFYYINILVGFCIELPSPNTPREMKKGLDNL